MDPDFSADHAEPRPRGMCWVIPGAMISLLLFMLAFLSQLADPVAAEGESRLPVTAAR